MTEKKICVIGFGLKGLATAAALTDLGHKVILADRDETILSAISKGVLPIYEPGLSSALSNAIRTRKLTLSNNLADSIKTADFIFITSQVPLLKSGAANLTALRETAIEIGKSLSSGKTIVVRSTVPPGTTENVVAQTIQEASKLTTGRDYGLAMSPLIIREGKALDDALHPKRLVVGAIRRSIAEEVLALFEKRNIPRIATSLKTAEFIEYASNAMSATIRSFSNEMANICVAIGIDASEVIEASDFIAEMDKGSLSPGVGFGERRLKDSVFALAALSESSGYHPELLKAVKKTNDKQHMRAIQMLKEELGGLKGKHITILGLATEIGTDNVEGSKAFQIAVELLAQGAKVTGYDPLATSAFIKLLPGISYASTAREALFEADGCIIQTREEEFTKLGKQDFDLMNTKVVVDGRRVLSPAKVEKYGVKFRAIGLGNKRLRKGR